MAIEHAFGTVAPVIGVQGAYTCRSIASPEKAMRPVVKLAELGTTCHPRSPKWSGNIAPSRGYAIVGAVPLGVPSRVVVETPVATTVPVSLTMTVALVETVVALPIPVLAPTVTV